MDFLRLYQIYEVREIIMTAFVLNPYSDRLELLKWIGNRNSHVPLPLLEFLVDTPPHVPDDDDFNEDDFRDGDYDEDDGWD